MAWLDPVTNWKSTDFINFSDYNRIKNNVAYILSIAPSLVADDYPTMGADKTSYLQYPRASEWNEIENALHQLAVNISGIFDVKMFMDNGNTPDNVELNRIEKMSLILKVKYESSIKAKYRMRFNIGRKRSVLRV